MKTGQRHRWWSAASFCLLALALLPLVGVYAGSPKNVAQLVVQPPTGSYQVGETIDVEVWVEDVVDLYGVDIRLAFDPTRLQVLDANPAIPGVQVTPRADLISPDFIIKREANNMAGTVWYAATQINPRPPASGSGAVFSFQFQALSAGVTAVEVTNDQLVDVNGNMIPVSVSEATYQIGSPDLTPTPSPTLTTTPTATPTATATSTATATGTVVATATPTATPEQTVTAALRVVPAAGSYLVGETIFVEVWVEDVVDLYAVDIKLAFDAGRLQVQDADPNVAGVQVIPRDDLLSPDLIVRREADNGAGTVWYAVTQLNPQEPVSGSGALFAFTFETVMPGTAAVTVTEMTLSTRDGKIIPANAYGAAYELTGGGGESYKLFLPVVLRSLE